MRSGRIAALLATILLVATGVYFLVYLWRWEWNRALIVGLMFLAVEVAMATAVVLRRLRQVADRLAAADPAVLSKIHQNAPPVRDHFEWLTPGRGTTGVFVPLLIGMGVVASGLAWLVERVARSTGGPVLERALASRLNALAWPTGLIAPDDDPDAILRGPVPSPR